MNNFQMSNHKLHTHLAAKSKNWAHFRSKSRTLIMEISKCVAV
jgi:predicted FMN-binding regulatory protein PaiB